MTIHIYCIWLYPPRSLRGDCDGKFPRRQVTLSEALTGFVRPISLLDGRTVHFRPEEGEVISPGAVRKLPVRDNCVGAVPRI